MRTVYDSRTLVSMIAYFYLIIFNMGQSRPLFSLFLSFSHSNINCTNWKKRIGCAKDSNLGLQDGRHWWNHRAMAAAHKCKLCAFWELNLVSQPEFPPKAYLIISFRIWKDENELKVTTMSFLEIPATRKEGLAVHLYEKEAAQIIHFMVYFVKFCPLLLSKSQT